MAEDGSVEEPEWMGLAWKLTAEIRQRRHAAGLSQPRLAARIGYTKQYVSLAERPQRGLPAASLVQAIDDALNAGGALVALHEQADDARKACRPGTPARTMAADATTGQEPETSSAHPDPGEVENAKRRELITTAAAITFGGNLDEPVAQILAAADQPQVPTRVRAGDVAYLRDAVETLKTLDNRLGGGPVRHQALAALRWATALLDSSCTPEIRSELATTTVDLADRASWATFDTGHHEPAQQVSLLGLRAAHQSGDLGVRAWVASGLACREIHVGHWARGLEFTQLALTAGDALTPNGLAYLHAVKALAYARKHDTATCLRYIGTATDPYQPDSVSTGPAWLGFLTPARFQGLLTKAKYDLLLGGADVGDHTAHRLDLIDHLSTAFHQYPAGRVHPKALTATRLATLLYLDGEQRGGHQMVEETITLAGRVRSARLADELRVLLKAMPTGEKTDDYTRDLRQRLALVLTEMS